MITMRNAWEPPRAGLDGPHTEDPPSPSGSRNGEFYLSSIDEQKKQNLFGQAMERSTSAPPPSGMSFDLDGKSLLLGLEGTSRGSNFNKANDDLLISSGTWNGGGLFGNNDHQPNSVTRNTNTFNSTDGLFSDSSSSLQQRIANSDIHEFRFDSMRSDAASSVGDFISRPKSAAPNFPNSTVGQPRAPPGLEHTSSIDTRFGASTSASETSSLFNDFDIMKIGSRRPASTGVIGQVPKNSSSVMESLGLIPAAGGAIKSKTLMDQIQEDFPKTPSPEFQQQQQLQSQQQPGHQDEITSASATGRSVFAENQGSVTNPPSGSVSHQTESGYSQQHFDYSTGRVQSSKLLHSVHSINKGSNNVIYNEQHIERPSHSEPHYISQQNHHVPSAPGITVVSQPDMQQNLYARQTQVGIQHIPGNAHLGHTQHPHLVHPQASYEAQTIYYSTQQRGGVTSVPNQIPTQVIQAGPGGAPHAIYVNPSPYGGYATVQYHHGTPPPHPHGNSGGIVHTHDPNIATGAHHPQEFMPAVPLQPGAHAQLAGVASNGAYIYWQHPTNANAPTQSASHSTMGVVDPNRQHGASIAVSPVSTIPLGTAPGSPGGTSSRHGRVKVSSGNGGKGGNEKGGTGKSKRGNTNGRRVATANSSLDNSKHSSGSITSSLLEEFRSAKNRSWTTNDIKGHVVEFCQDQNGSRFIQQRLEIADDAEKKLVMAEVLPSVRRLRNDVFGNYVVQKLLEHGTPEMKLELKGTLQGEILSLSMQMYGCRVVQKALESLSDKDLPGLLSEFHGHVHTCIHDQNGNHVIQKCIEVMSSKAKAATAEGDEEKAKKFCDDIQFIVDSALETVAPLSCHPYGCRVLQRILEHSVEPQKTRTLDDISKCHRVLLDDQYGNYVIQHVLQFGRNSDRDSILQIVVESGLLALSRQKFASNVVEKLLKYGTPGHRNAIVREMLNVVEGKGIGEDGKGSSVVLLMVRDAYANYVVQTTLDVVSEGEEKRLLLEELNKNSAQLRNYTFAKHIVTKLGT